MAPPSEILHIANGHSTTALIGPAGIAGELSIWADVLHEGPVPSGLSDEELLRVRAMYLAEPAASPDEVVAEFRKWGDALESVEITCDVLRARRATCCVVQKCATNVSAAERPGARTNR